MKTIVTERYAALRPTVAGRLYIDLGSLSDSAEGAHRLAQRRDAQDHRAIRTGQARSYARVTRVEIREVK